MANQEHLKIFQQGISVWNQWRKENPDLKPDLSHADLSNIDLSNTNILNADMSYADLSDSNFSNTKFFSVNLSNSIFKNTNFIKVVFPKNKDLARSEMYLLGSYDPNKCFNLNHTNLSYAILRKADFSSTSLSETTMHNANFTNASFVDISIESEYPFVAEKVDLSGANFIECDLRNLNLKRYFLKGCNLSKSNLIDMDLSNISFESINLSGAKIVRANLSNANLTKATLKNVDLSQANLNYAQFNDSDCEEINLNKADLSYSCFFKANMSRANLYQSKCYQTDFTEANLESSSFGYSDCLRASFYQSNLRSSAFNGANITFANFKKANLQKSFLYAANAINCNFSSADLTDACLAAMRGIDANFSEANLTGVCIEDWNINAKTNLQNTLCDYVYNKSGWDDDGKFLPSDRLPHDPAINFKTEEFEKFIQKAQNTVDLIFTNGIDWQAFLRAFLKLKSETGDELSIYSIEDKWDSYFVVRVNVPSDVNKKELEGALRREYELREDKKFLQQCVMSLTMSLESLSEAQRKQSSMSGDTFNINANNSPVSIAKDNATQNIHAINEILEQHKDISESAAEIQKLLTQLQNQGLSEKDAQEKVADELATKAKSDSTMMEKLKSLGKSFGSASGKALVTEVVKAVFKLALEKSGIHLDLVQDKKL